MDIPDLEPDITFPKLRLLHSDIEFAFEAKQAAMGPHIVSRWGWEESFQRKLHIQRFSEKPFFEIRKGESRLGTLSFQVFSDHVRLGEFYLFPDFQRRGTGTHVLKHCLSISDGLSLPVRLEYLHWNPVGSLYRRHGFVEIGQTETHCFLQRPVKGPPF
ncbi:GNAT family N-acetyltransferase [Roseibium aggregatum]|uniref:GNAT family N-acetyltransferase n=1 Tax=Roseibium aggregatum TaxID=187304 RepID=A0A939J4X4_9HYPH|nr:GNAT family N-acetyltransferase [Roseibium aggregatum]MBN9671625.1 GNAT family N-acetyltransferase [Roseibium aggregatum]